MFAYIVAKIACNVHVGGGGGWKGDSPPLFPDFLPFPIKILKLSCLTCRFCSDIEKTTKNAKIMPAHIYQDIYVKLYLLVYANNSSTVVYGRLFYSFHIFKATLITLKHINTLIFCTLSTSIVI